MKQNTQHNHTYLALFLLSAAALLLAILPALMVWVWRLMPISDPVNLLALAASWVCALAILAGCAWYYRKLRAEARAADTQETMAADIPVPTL